MSSPFDYIKSIDQHSYKEDLSDYVPFVINRGLSFSMDTVLYANEMNKYPGLDPKCQYDYLFHAIRPKKRHFKWFKGDQSKSNDLEVVQAYYGMNKEKARQAMLLLTDEQLTIIKNRLIEGG